MKRRHAVLVVAIVLAAFAPASADEQIVTITPEKPTVGAEITIRYHPTVKGALLFGKEAVEVQVLVLRGKESPFVLEAPMKKAGKVWEARLKIDDPQSLFGMVQFASEKITDNNQGQYWDFLLYETSGKPAQGAHLAKSKSYTLRLMDFRREKNLSRAREEAMAEESFYPGQPETKLRLGEISFNEKGKDSTLVRELDALTQEFADDDDNSWRISSWYRAAGQAEKSQALEEQLIAKNPKGKLARQIKLQRIYLIRDKDERARLALELHRDFPDLESEEKSSIAGILLSAKQLNKAEEIIAAIQPPNGNLLNGVAWEYIEKETNIERAVALAKQGVEAFRNPAPNSKPSTLTQKRWEEMNRYRLAMALDTYALGLFKLERYQEAKSAYREAYDLTEGKNADINERFVQCCLKSGDYADALEITKASIEKSKYNDKLLEYGKAALTKKQGNAEGFDKLVAAAKERAVIKAKEKLLAERIGKPAPDFSAKNLAGETVQLTQLKGKVVVLDFWATWCGPCRKAFPYVQTVYEKYKNDPDVVILAVNTWENESGAEREKPVKKFLEDNKYTFPVVYAEAGVVEKI